MVDKTFDAISAPFVQQAVASQLCETHKMSLQLTVVNKPLLLSPYIPSYSLKQRSDTIDQARTDARTDAIITSELSTLTGTFENIYTLG